MGPVRPRFSGVVGEVIALLVARVCARMGPPRVRQAADQMALRATTRLMIWGLAMLSQESRLRAAGFPAARR